LARLAEDLFLVRSRRPVMSLVWARSCFMDLPRVSRTCRWLGCGRSPLVFWDKAGNATASTSKPATIHRNENWGATNPDQKGKKGNKKSGPNAGYKTGGQRVGHEIGLFDLAAGFSRQGQGQRGAEREALERQSPSEP
jgi:hypothetical protein